jgi:phosphoribosyl 1,2-cyclic phosphodiesterase
LIRHFQSCHAAFLETNYDETMLEQGRYPYFLKNRIRGGKGHLSNSQALELFTAHKPAFMSHLFLSHLSKDNNNPDMVQELFRQHANGTEIVVASRYTETAVYTICA